MKKSTYIAFADRLKLAIENNEDLSQFQSNPNWVIYAKNKEMLAWKQYKSDQYKQLETNYRIYNELNKLINTSIDDNGNPVDLDYSKVSEIAGSQIQNREQLDVFLLDISSDKYLKLLCEKKHKSSDKFRLPDSVLTGINNIAQLIAISLLENALEAAADEKVKTVRIKHILDKPLDVYSTFPLIKLTTPYKTLLDREQRRLEFDYNKSEKYRSLSNGKGEQPETTFNAQEYADNKCEIFKNGDRTDYRWHNIELINNLNKAILPAVNRIAGEVKRAKQGKNIKDLKVSKHIKTFIAGVIEDIIVRLFKMLKSYSENIGVKTFNLRNLDFCIDSLVNAGGDLSGVDYSVLYQYKVRSLA